MLVDVGAIPEGTKTIVLLLTGSIPETKLNGLLAGCEVDYVVVEHGGHIPVEKGELEPIAA